MAFSSCTREGVSGERICMAELEHSSTASPTDYSSTVTDMRNVKNENVNRIQELEAKPTKSTPDLDTVATTSEVGRIPPEFGSKLHMGIRRRETISNFKSRRWSFSSRRPTSQSFKGKQLLQRRNSIESKAHHEKEQPSQKPSECKRLHMRRGALSNPELMAMPQTIREKVQKAVEVRQKSLKRKISNFLTVRLDLDKEVDLF